MSISMGEPISLALGRTGTVLFKPFKFKKWMTIAFCAGLALLGEGGGSFNYNTRSSGGGGGGPWPTFDAFKDWLHTYLAIVIVVGVAGLAIIIALYLLFRWLNCRGQFMFLDNIVNNEAAVAVPWREYRAEGNSLFLVRVAVDMIAFGILLVLLGIATLFAWGDISNALRTEDYHFGGGSALALVFLLLSMLVFVVLMAIVQGLILGLALPVMYIRRVTAKAALHLAWREMFLPNKGSCLLYFLMRFVIGIVQAIWSVIGLLLFGLVTCCVGFLVVIIPGVGSYILAIVALPVLTFERAFRLYFVSQFGSAYQVQWKEPVPMGGFPVMPETPQPPQLGA